MGDHDDVGTKHSRILLGVSIEMKHTWGTVRLHLCMSYLYTNNRRTVSKSPPDLT